MIGSGERAYAYAKACGIIGKSYVGRRMKALGQVTRLAELDRLVFPINSRNLPERELLPDLEKRFAGRFQDAADGIVACFRDPPEFLVLLSRPGDTEQPDQRYYSVLWTAMMKLPKKDRWMSEKILSEEIALRNTVWAMRLRSYYRMDSEEIKQRLVYPEGEPGRGRRATDWLADALLCLELPLDNMEAWRSWRWASFLNPGQSGEAWTVDPRYFQNAASEYLYNLSKRNFHRDPFSLDTVFCFIKIKQFEEDILTSLSEGISLGMSSKDVFALLEVAP